MHKIDYNEVRQLYNEMNEIWPTNDKWYEYTYKEILTYLKTFEKEHNINKNTLIINAGSAGNTYGITGEHYHIDISEKHLLNVPNSVVGSIENMPFTDSYFDVCICVGSVINYCDAFCSLGEIYRVLKPKGLLVLDFDQSKSFEYFGTKYYSENAEIVETFNSGFKDRTWIYSENYIDSVLKSCNFKTLKKHHYHCLSALAYRFSKDEIKASKYARFDKLVTKIPFLKNISCNIILTAQKI